MEMMMKRKNKNKLPFEIVKTKKLPNGQKLELVLRRAVESEIDGENKLIIPPEVFNANDQTLKVDMLTDRIGAYLLEKQDENDWQDFELGRPEEITQAIVDVVKDDLVNLIDEDLLEDLLDPLVLEEITPTSGGRGTPVQVKALVAPSTIPNCKLRFSTLDGSKSSLAPIEDSTLTGVNQHILKTTVPDIGRITTEIDVEIALVEYREVTIVIPAPGTPAVTIELPVRSSNKLSFVWNPGPPIINDFRINSYDGDVTINPNRRNIRVSWNVEHVRNIHARRISTHGPNLSVQDDFGLIKDHEHKSTGIGHFLGNSPADATYELIAQNEYGSVSQMRTVKLTYSRYFFIDGVEVTQAIQFYKASQHLTDANDQGGDNSLALVANKPAWVRVYLKSNQDPTFADIPDVTGELVIDRFVDGQWEQNINSLSPVNSSRLDVKSNPVYKDERSDINATLNFIIPAESMSGRLRLKIDAFSQYIDVESSTSTKELEIAPPLKRVLNLILVPISYAGPDYYYENHLDLKPPGSVGEYDPREYISLLTELIFPTCSFDTHFAQIIPTMPISWIFPPLHTKVNRPAKPEPLGESWQLLLAEIEKRRHLLPSHVAVGFLADGTPVAGRLGLAWRNRGVCVVTKGGGTTAHEIGHAVSLKHSPCGDVAGVDENYPAYEDYDDEIDIGNLSAASIGEYGLNINNGTILEPSIKDIMSYCNNTILYEQWISIYHHRKLIASPWLQPGYVHPPPPYKTSHNKMISIVGFLDENNKISISFVVRLGGYSDVAEGQKTNMIAELLDEKGKVISSGAIYQFQLGDFDLQKVFMIKAKIPDVAPGYEMRICEGQNVLWNRKRISDKVVEISKFEIAPQKEHLRLQWLSTATSKDGSEVWIRYSRDDGKSWLPLTIEKSDMAMIPYSIVPSGTILFEAMFHDGFLSTSVVSEPIMIPFRPPATQIIFPQDNAKLHAGVIRLRGIATSCTFEPIESQNCHWFINGKRVGTGKDIWVNLSEIGSHEVRFVASDDHGETGVRSSFEIVSRIP
jgi:hypothetical protein